MINYLVARRSTAISAILVLCVFIAAFLHRQVNDLNYGEIHVRIAPEWRPEIAAVLVRLKDNRLSTLRPREEDRDVYSMLNGVTPVTSVVICGKSGFHPGGLTPEIRCGENWIGPGRTLPVVSPPQTLTVSQSASNEQRVWFEFAPEPYSKNRLLSTVGALNWQGDFWMIGVPLLQTLLSVLLLWAGYYLLPKSGLSGTEEFSAYAALNLRDTPLFSLAFGSVRCILILLILQQLFEFWPLLRDVRWGQQFSVAFLGLAGLLAVVFFYIRSIRNAGSDRRRIVFAGIFLFASLGLKFLWVLNIDSVQTGDYEKYWRYGKALAMHDAAQIGDANWPTRIVYLQRAWAFTNPIVRMLGPNFSAIEISSVLIQFLTTVLCALLIRRMFSLQAACCSLPFLILYPPFWYAPTLAAINTAGFLSMIVIWCLVDVGTKFLCSLYGKLLATSDYLKWGGLTVLFAVFLALIDLQKLFGIFVIFTAVFTGCYAVLRYLWMPYEKRPLNFFRTVFMAVAMLYFSWHFSRMMQKSVNADLVRMNGPFPALSMVEYLSSVDSTTNGDGRSLDNWRFAYVPVVPKALRNRLLFRKLLHEKVASGIDLWLCALRKNAFMSLQTDYKNRTFGGYAAGVEGRWEFTRVPWNSTQNWILQGFYSVMLLLSLHRLLCSKMMPIAASELFPIVFVVFQYLVILMALEAGPYYGHILGFPLAWSAGLVVSRISNGPRSVRALTPELFSMLPGALTLTVVIVWHLIAGMAVDRSELAFLKIQQKEDAAPSGAATVELSRVHAALSFPAGTSRLRSGDSVTASFVIPAAFARNPELCFFLSVNARARNIYRKNTYWDALPIEYELVAGEKVVRKGQLGELHPPVLIQLSREDFAVQRSEDSSTGSLPELKLTLKCLADLNISASGVMPAIAIEYAFNPLEASPQVNPAARTEQK